MQQARTKPYVIALEEHYADPAVMALGDGRRLGDAALVEKLSDLGHLRVAEMDAAGIDKLVDAELAKRLAASRPVCADRPEPAGAAGPRSPSVPWSPALRPDAAGTVR